MTTQLSCNGVTSDVTRSDTDMPTDGCWVSQVEHVSAPVTVGSVASLVIDNVSLVGTVVSSAKVTESRSSLTLVAGKATMSSFPSAQTLSGPSLRQCIVAVVPDEVLATVKDIVTDTRVSSLTVSSDVIRGLQLTRLLHLHGMRWRMTLEGTLDISQSYDSWVVPDDWTDIEPPLAAYGRWKVQRLDSLPQPDGSSVGLVSMSTDSSGVSVTAYPPKQSLTDTWKHVATYECTVIRQSESGRLDLDPDDKTIAGTGMQAVQIRYGLPGIKVNVSPGTRCSVAYDRGDPTRPYVCHFFSDTDAAACLITVGDGTDYVALKTPTNHSLEELDSRITALESNLNSFVSAQYNVHVHPTGVGPSGVTTSQGSQSSTSADVVDVTCTALRTR